MLVVAAVPLGLVVGGFLTMVVDRVPDRTPLGWRSRCPRCEHPLGVAEVVPVASWLVLRGRCAHCGGRITPAYPVVELVTAAAFVLVAARFGAEWVVIPPLVLVAALVALSTVDLYVYRLPDRITFPAIGLSLVAMVGVSLAVDLPGAIPRALVGALGYFAILLLAHLVSPRGMGFGDVKLALLLGLHLGWVAGVTYLGWSPVIRLVFYALLLGCLIGVGGGLAVAVARRGGRREVLVDPEMGDGQPARVLAQSFPFGPALAAGTVVVVLFSDAFLGA